MSRNIGSSIGGMPSGGGPPEMISARGTRGSGNSDDPGSSRADGPVGRAAVAASPVTVVGVDAVVADAVGAAASSATESSVDAPHAAAKSAIAANIVGMAVRVTEDSFRSCSIEHLRRKLSSALSPIGQCHVFCSHLRTVGRSKSLHLANPAGKQSRLGGSGLPDHDPDPHDQAQCQPGTPPVNRTLPRTPALPES